MARKLHELADAMRADRRRRALRTTSSWLRIQTFSLPVFFRTAWETVSLRGIDVRARIVLALLFVAWLANLMAMR